MIIPCELDLQTYIQEEGAPPGFGLLWLWATLKFDARQSVCLAQPGKMICIHIPYASENDLLLNFTVVDVLPRDEPHWFELRAFTAEVIQMEQGDL